MLDITYVSHLDFRLTYYVCHVFQIKVERHRSTAGVEHEVIFYEMLIRDYVFDIVIVNTQTETCFAYLFYKWPFWGPLL